VLSMIVF